LGGTYEANWLTFVTSSGRIHAGWRQLGANSGRMACSKPNLQNLPRDPRCGGEIGRFPASRGNSATTASFPAHATMALTRFDITLDGRGQLE
jgi:DNA polymerase I-like protein with 3'-5' exonuclease and polymerase domains